MLSRTDLHDYQERAVSFIKDNQRCALWLDMGLGKTVSTLTAISDLVDSFQVGRVLIIAPLRVANSVWKQEVCNWQHLHGLSVNVCTGSERNRLSKLNSLARADIYVINRENVQWLVKHYGEKWPFDMVVIDESSSFKSGKSQRFKALKKVLHQTDYMVLLTGTPAPNGLLDLWSQLYLIDFGERLGRTISGYKNRFFNAEGYGGYKLVPKPQASEKIYDLVSDCVLSMQAKDYIEVPDRIDLVETVTLSDKMLADYKRFERDLLIELEDDEYIEASTAAVLAGKLLQWCNGAVYLDDTKKYTELHKLKLDALADIVSDNAGENILVAYNFKSDLERLTARFPQAVVLDKDPQTVRDWNDGKIPMLLAHPASAGHGLNLQRGGALAVWFGLNWSLELYQQFNGRLHRQGQTRPVRIVHIVADGCLDSRVMRVLGDKDAEQHNLINALKATD